MCAAALWTSAAFAGPGGFAISPLLANGQWNNPTSIAMDADGFIHMAYMTQFDTDSATKEIWYATNSSGKWTHTRLTNNSVREEFPHLVLDGVGNVHIAFHSGTTTTNYIRYLNNVGVPPNSPPGTFNPIIDISPPGYKIVKHAIDGTGKAHFTFTSQTSNSSDEVFYTTWDAIHGVGPLVNLSNSPGNETANDIAVDSNGVAHVVYYDGTFSGPLVYLTNAGGTWNPSSTGVASTTTLNPIVLVAPGDVVRIVYRDTDVLYSINKPVGGSFSSAVPIYNGQTYRPSFYNKFAVDDEGHLHIAFASNVNTLRGIIYIEETAGGFQPPVSISSTTGGNQGTSIAVGPSGAVAVSYSISGFDSGTSVVYADISLAARGGPSSCPADIAGGDGAVNVSDLLLVIGEWGPCDPAPAPCPADINGDLTVNVTELLAVVAAWGACP